jgi:hypothetical protein
LIGKGGTNLKKEKGLRFTFQQIVEVFNPEDSCQINGMVDYVQTTEGYAELNDNNEVDCLVIDKCEVDTGKRKLINTDVLKVKEGYVKIINGVLRQ